MPPSPRFSTIYRRGFHVTVEEHQDEIAYKAAPHPLPVAKTLRAVLASHATAFRGKFLQVHGLLVHLRVSS